MGIATAIPAVTIATTCLPVKEGFAVHPRGAQEHVPHSSPDPAVVQPVRFGAPAAHCQPGKKALWVGQCISKRSR